MDSNTTRELAHAIYAAQSGDDWQEVRETLARLAAIPRTELPDGPDREALARLVEMGFVECIYRPHGGDFHNLWWRRMVPGIPQRERVADWLAGRQAMAARDAREDALEDDLASLRFARAQAQAWLTDLEQRIAAIRQEGGSHA